MYRLYLVSEKTQQCLDAAMIEGEVSLRNGSLLLLGVGGSGNLDSIEHTQRHQEEQ